LLLEQGSKQGEGSVEDGEQGKRCKALKGSDLPLRSGADMSRSGSFLESHRVFRHCMNHQACPIHQSLIPQAEHLTLLIFEKPLDSTSL
jgi:hypothetical protein